MRLNDKRARLALGVSAIALAGALALGDQALAASDSSTLKGHVNGASAGTTVTVVDATTGQRTTATVGSDGNYVLIGLRPSTYHVQVGAGAAADVTLPVGQTVTVDLDANAAAATTVEGVVVAARRNRSEVRTAEVATNVTPSQIENLPQNDRNFLNFAALAPGVALSVDPNHKGIQAGAVSPDNVNVFIDGESLKSQVGHGGVVGQSFSQGNPFPQLAIQEFKVDTQNFKAEYEQAGSAIITSVTKTGGEEMHGSAFYEYMPRNWFGRKKFDRPGEVNNPTGSNPKPDYKRQQYGAEMGGPIIKDKLHYYLAYEGTTQTNPHKSVALDPLAPADVRTAENGTFADPFKQDLYFGKLTWFATNNDTVNLSYFDRSESDHTDYGGIDARSHGRNLDTTTKVTLLEWKHRGDNWLNEASLSRQESNTGTPNVTPGPEKILTNGQFGQEVAHLGAHFFQQTSEQKLTTFRDSLTYTGFNWNGEHVIKLGFKYAATDLTRNESDHVNGTLFYDVSAGHTYNSSATPYFARVNLVPNADATARNNQIGLYAQDDWTVDQHLTVNLGLRWDYESNMFDNKFVTPGYIVTALQNYPNWTAAGIDYRNYVSTGNERKAFKGALQPRLGVSYDVNGDRDLVFFGGIGRYYDRTTFLAAQIERIKDSLQNIVGGAVSTSDLTAIRTQFANSGAHGDVWLLNNDTKVPYSDQFNIGVRKKFGDIQTSVILSHIESHHIFQYVRGNRLPNGTYTSQGINWVEDSFPAAGQLPGFNGKLNIGSSKGEAKYDAIYLTVDKPFTAENKYGFTASLTLNNAKSNVAQELTSDEVWNSGDQTGFGWQRVNGVDKWRFVGTGIVAGPWDTRVSGTLTLARGPQFGSTMFPAGAPEQACCIVNLGGVYSPKQKIAYQNFDLRIAKDINLPWGNTVTVDGSIFNVFDHVNRTYSAWNAGSGTNPSRSENDTVGNARSYQVGVRYKW